MSLRPALRSQLHSGSIGSCREYLTISDKQLPRYVLKGKHTDVHRHRNAGVLHLQAPQHHALVLKGCGPEAAVGNIYYVFVSG